MKQPWNRPGTEKSWVMRNHHSFHGLLAAIARAERV